MKKSIILVMGNSMALLGVLAVNALANILPINGMNTIFQQPSYRKTGMVLLCRRMAGPLYSWVLPRCWHFILPFALQSLLFLLLLSGLLLESSFGGKERSIP